MAESRKNQIDDGERTSVAVKNADKTSEPVPNDAESNDPPLRTNRPDVPVAAVLTDGAGKHDPRVLDREADDGTPVDKDGLDADGRVRADAK